MKKINILDTEFARTYNMGLMAKDAVKFLVAKQSVMDRPSDNYMPLIGDINPMISSHMNTLFKNLVSKDKLKELYMFSMIRGTADDLPELLTIDDIIIDGKYVSGNVPKDLQKSWVNLTSSLSINKNDRVGLLQVNDIPKAISTIVRAFLCMSYNDSKEWLTPKAASFLVEYYTMAMEMVMDRLYNLNYEESVVPKLLFAWHYAELLSDPDEKSEIPALLSKTSHLFKGNLSGTSIQDLLSSIVAFKGADPMSIDMVTKCLAQFGAPRMKNISKANIYRYFALSSAENTALTVAMDYPPYLLHQILKVVAGGKHAILSNVYKTRFDKKHVERTLDQIVMDKALIEGVNR